MNYGDPIHFDSIKYAEPLDSTSVHALGEIFFGLVKVPVTIPD